MGYSGAGPERVWKMGWGWEEWRCIAGVCVCEVVVGLD